MINSIQFGPIALSSVKQLAGEAKKELTNNIVPYWLKLMDPRGGFFSFVSFDNVRNDHSEKSALLNSRILWFFSRAARELTDPGIKSQCRAAAQHAYDFLRSSLIDPEYGGVYWVVDENGNPLDTQKHVYNQAFAIYALSEWYDLTKDQVVLSIIDGIYTLIETHARDVQARGYFEAFDREWQPIANLLVCDTEDVISDKSMNTHLHVMEAYSRLYDVKPNEKLKRSLQELISLMTKETLNSQFSFFPFFDRNWTVRSVNHSYGHDIEGSWLIWEAAEKVYQGEALEKIQQVILSMADTVKYYGIDYDGAVCNEWIDNQFIDTKRVWWVQAEAVVGFFNAWQISGESDYLSIGLKSWEVIQTRFVDGLYGEWHHEVDRWGVPNKDQSKVSGWKCPYHNGRACLEILSRSRQVA